MTSGGSRVGAGRKPKFAVQLARQALTNRHDAATYALDLFIGVMADEQLDIVLRLKCGEVVMDRVWGKPKNVGDQFDWRSAALQLGIDPDALKRAAVNAILGSNDTGRVVGITAGGSGAGDTNSAQRATVDIELPVQE